MDNAEDVTFMLNKRKKRKEKTRQKSENKPYKHTFSGDSD